MSTITAEQQLAICERVKGMHLPSGLGNESEACSIAAINLALTGRLTSEIPACMSRTIGRWIIRVQDSMPDEMRNSREWKALLPYAAGTGRANEAERARLIAEWMWECLTLIQHVADKHGFGTEWNRMTSERTDAAADAARYAAATAAAAADAAAADAAATAATAAADAARYAAATAAAAADADAATAAADAAADAARYADDAATAARYTAARYDFWQKADPPALLRKLILVSEQIPEAELC